MPCTDVKLDIFRGIKHRMVLNYIISAREHIGDSISSQVLQLLPGNYVKKTWLATFFKLRRGVLLLAFPMDVICGLGRKTKLKEKIRGWVIIRPWSLTKAPKINASKKKKRNHKKVRGERRIGKARVFKDPHFIQSSRVEKSWVNCRGQSLYTQLAEELFKLAKYPLQQSSLGT